MGTILSSTRNYNRALARQPRKSINLPKFEVSNIEQQPLAEILSIPYPVRISQVNDQVPSSELNPTFNQPIQSTNFQVTQEQSSPVRQSIIPSPTYSSQTAFPTHYQTMQNDAVVIRRSIINLNKHHRLNNNQLRLSSPSRSIVERNGKRFVSEMNERMERRYVQVFDYNLGQMRFFEVTDYIPTRTVRSMRNNSQFPSQNRTLNGRITTPSNLHNFGDLYNRETVAREFDLYHSGAQLPSYTTNNPPLASSYQPQDSSDSSYYYPQQTGYNSSSSNGYNQHPTRPYQSNNQSFRPHSPTASEYSGTVTSARSGSQSSDAESIDRVLTPTHLRPNHNQNRNNSSNRTTRGREMNSEPDLFAKSGHMGNHMYAKRSNFNSYAQPNTNYRGAGAPGTSDYAPLPITYNQSNQNYNDDSDAYDG